VLTPNPIAESTIVTIAICITVPVIALGLGGPLVLGTGAILFALAAALLIAAARGRRIEAHACPDLNVGAEIITRVGLTTCVTITII
jgi:hypothetical protein